jgi:glycosyltransferase involved in cell wall biosynthesis
MSETVGRSLLQICPNDHPPFKDICRYYAAAARMLGWSVTTCFLGPPQADPLDDAVYLDAPDLRRTAALGGSLLRAWQSEAGDAPGGVPPTLALCHRYRAYRILLASGLPVEKIVTVAHEFGFFARRRRRLTVRARRLVGRRDLVFAGVSDAVQRELLAVDPQAVLLPNGIDLARADNLRFDRAEARALLSLADDTFCVGVVGRLHPKKSPALALEGFRLAAQKMPGAHLVFIGSGELAASLQRAARDLPVTFAGFVPEAARYFSGLDLLLLPSSSSEAFGMVALEAMAAELPVLSSPAPGPSYVLGSLGDYFQPATPPVLAQALETAYGRWRTPDHGGVATTAARERASALFSLDAAANRLQRLVEPVAPDQ